jgi:excisionase family DNA binding protein
VSGHPSVPALIVEALDEAALDSLADRLAPRIAERLVEVDDRWLSTTEAASYLGVSIHALHKLTAARTIPFEQEGPGCRLWFRRSELDCWRRGGDSGSMRSASTSLPRAGRAAS